MYPNNVEADAVVAFTLLPTKGIVSSSRDVHLLKIELPREVILLGNITFLRLEQLENA